MSQVFHDSSTGKFANAMSGVVPLATLLPVRLAALLSGFVVVLWALFLAALLPGVVVRLAALSSRLAPFLFVLFLGMATCNTYYVKGTT